MVTERLELQGSQVQDSHVQHSGSRDVATAMDSALSRMGASTIITVSGEDPEDVLRERYGRIIVTLVTNRSKEPLHLYHWMPVAEHKPDHMKRKAAILRMTVDGKSQIGVPFEYFFRDKGASNLMIREADGDTPLLQFLRTLSDKPGHAVTFSRGELRQVDFTYRPSSAILQPVPAPEVAGTRDDQPSLRPARKIEKRKRTSEPSIPQSIKLLFTLPEADRLDILSRMPDRLRNSIEVGFYVNEEGLHRRQTSDLSIDPGTWHARMLKAAQFIHERISVSADGKAVRKLTNLEHARQVFGIHAAPVGMEMSTTLAEVHGRSAKKKKRRKGWIRE